MVLPVDLRHRVVDGCIPSDLGTSTSAEIEEERRLLYVAMTRQGRFASRRPAALLHAWPERAGSRHVYASRTRFILDTLLNLLTRGPGR